MICLNKKEFVHKMLCEAQSAVNAIGDVDPDIHEKLDEVVLAIYDQFDVSFKRCADCEEDVLVEIAVEHEGKDYCRACDERNTLTRADAQDCPAVKS